jgi:hypothetical protein
MKREAVGHTKMKRLCRRLDLPLWQAIGLLESLWLLTGREAPRGDIGKLTDEDIALGIDYRGDEGAMLEALVGTGWLDRNPDGRLIIHDWADHADDAVHMRLARARLFFVGGRAPKLTRLTGKEKESAHKFYSSAQPVRTPCAQKEGSSAPPEPVPEPVPVPEPSTEEFGADAPLVLVSPDSNGKPKKSASNRKPYQDVLEQVAGSIHARHPSGCRRRNLDVEGVIKKLEAILKHNRIPTAEAEAYLRRIDRNHTAACKSEEWQKDDGRWARGLRNYLSPRDGEYNIEPTTVARQEPVRLMA